MIRQRFTLPDFEWTVYVYYVVTRPDADEILYMLDHIGCAGEDMERAVGNLMSGKCNTGLTYSNSSTRETVMVIAKTTTPMEFVQSWTHEIGHIADHIAQKYDINPHGEDIRYLQDEIIAETYPIAKQFLCECSLKKLRQQR